MPKHPRSGFSGRRHESECSRGSTVPPSRRGRQRREPPRTNEHLGAQTGQHLGDRLRRGVLGSRCLPIGRVPVLVRATAVLVGEAIPRSADHPAGMQNRAGRKWASEGVGRWPDIACSPRIEKPPNWWHHAVVLEGPTDEVALEFDCLAAADQSHREGQGLLVPRVLQPVKLGPSERSGNLPVVIEVREHIPAGQQGHLTLLLQRPQSPGRPDTPPQLPPTASYYQWLYLPWRAPSGRPHEQ